MARPLLALATSALVLVGGMAHAQHHEPGEQPAAPPPAQQGAAGMGMGPGMMQMMQRRMGGQHGPTGAGMMAHRGMLPLMFAIMDADGDGALALQEVQDIHARIFRHVDADGNGRVTKEEIAAFFGSAGPAAPVAR